MIADAVKAHRFVKALWAACEKEIIMTISEKVAYLKGLAEGLDLDTAKSKEGKLISVMIGILEEIAAAATRRTIFLRWTAPTAATP